MKISVIGGGSWGTAISKLLAENGNEVFMWTIEEKVFESMRWNENPYYLPGIKIDNKVISTMDIDESLDNSKIVVLALPAQVMRQVLPDMKSLKDNSIVVNLAKGIEIKTGKLLSDIFREYYGENPYVALSGPTHAEEVARKIPTGIVSAGFDEEACAKVQKIFSNEYFRVYSNTDLKGVEVSGALKNVYAIAAGIVDGIGPWDNTKAALITRALVEFERFGRYFGGRFETFMGLSGIGDLMVTCSSKHSRNRYVGEQIGRGKKVSDILDSMNMIAEGVYTAKAVYDIAKSNNITMPIALKTYQVLYEDLNPEKALKELMHRDLKPEFNFKHK